jgi:hypothetical protein
LPRSLEFANFRQLSTFAFRGLWRTPAGGRFPAGIGLEKKDCAAGLQPARRRREPPPAQMSQPALVDTQQPLQGGDHPSMGDHQYRPGRVRRGNPLYRSRDPRREGVPGLAAWRGAQPAVTPGVERTRPATLDLGAGETAPVTDVILTKAGIDQDAVGETELNRCQFGRDPGPLKIGRCDCGKAFGPQQSPGRPSLLTSLR